MSPRTAILQSKFNFGHAKSSNNFSPDFRIFIWGWGTSTNFFSFSTFSNHFTQMQLKITHNGKFCQKSGLDWLKMTNLVILHAFPSFPPNGAQIDSEWPISPDLHIFPSFATKASHFWRNLKNFCSRGGSSANFLRLATF